MTAVIPSQNPATRNIESTSVQNNKPILNIKKRTRTNALKRTLQMTNFEEVVFPISNLSETIITNKHSTSAFLKLFIKYRICSQRHFHSILTKDKDLMDAYLQLPYNLTNQIINKGLTVAQSSFKPNTFLEKCNDTAIGNSKFVKRLAGLFYEFLNDVTAENYLPKNCLLKNIFDCLLYRDNKRMTLGLIGASNTGKTFLTDVITGSFDSFEIGNILPPMKDNLSEFWLANCIYASIKRMEELILYTNKSKSL